MTLRLVCGAVVAFAASFVGGASVCADPPAAAGATVTICVAVAADGSPIYPLTELPSKLRGFWMVTHLPPASTAKRVEYLWSAVDVPGVPPERRKVFQGDEPVKDGAIAPVEMRLPRDIPIGTYHIELTADGAPLAHVDFPVVAGPTGRLLEKTDDLLPLSEGTTWSYALTVTTGPVLVSFELPGTEKGADGKLRAPVAYRAGAASADGTPIEIRRAGTLVDTQWWRAEPKGLFFTRDKTADGDTTFDPPCPLVKVPLSDRAEWTWSPKGMTGATFRAVGPLPMRAPAGSTVGWLVLASQSAGIGSSTLERQIVPGVGVVHESRVNAANGKLTLRFDLDLTAGPGAGK